MVKLKAPQWGGNYDRYKKLLLIWLRTLESTNTDSDIVSAVILGLNKENSSANEQACELVLDMDEDQLYPDLTILAGAQDEADANAREEAIKNYMADQLRNHPEKKVIVGNTARIIPGLNIILKALHEKFGLKQEEKMFQNYEEYANLSRDTSKETMKDYIIKAETLTRKLAKQQIVLPDIVLAYNLLKGANLGKDEKLARTSVDVMTFDNMKKTLLKMSDGIMEMKASDNQITPKVKVKEEVIMYQDEEQELYEDSYNTGYEPYLVEQEDSNRPESSENEEHNCLYIDRRAQYHNNISSGFRGQRGYNNSRGGYSTGQIRGSYRGQYQPRQVTYQSERGQRRTNRYNSTCAICKSIYHWARECPHKDKAPAPILKLDQDMVIDDDNLIYNTFTDTVNLGILDSGAAKTVCGKKWYEVYENSLTEEEKKHITEENAESTFRFGDGDEIKSYKVKLFPTKICGKDVIIRANIVDNDIPLLISKVTLKNARACLNFDQDQLEMDGVAQKLVNLPSNHYAIPIGRQEEDLTSEEKEKVTNLLINEVYFETEDPKKMAWKIHRYFAHASPEKLKQFVSTTNHPKKAKIIEEIDNLDCNLCKKYKREAPRPRVCLPMADRFNQTVALDLKFLDGGEVIVHAIDLLTRFSSAMIVKDKSKEEIVEKFFMMWIAIFGRPEQTLCDNGKEFCNEDFVSMCTNLDINMETTAAFAPWSNGVVERHNGLLAEMIEKIQSETGCSTQIALCWALNAKNSMSNVHGFSPQQLVFGYNTYCPGLDNGIISLSQIEGIASSKIVADNLNAMYEARSAFLSAQNSDRMKRALKGRVYKAYETKYFIGDRVYYRTVDNEWRGPGIVIGQYKKLVLVKTGGLFVRVYPNRLILKTDADKMLNSGKVQDDEATECSGGEYEEECRIVEDRQRRHNSDDSSEDSSQDGEEEISVQDDRLAENRENQTRSLQSETEASAEIPDLENETNDWQDIVKDARKDRYVLKPGDEIRFKANEDDSWRKAVVIGNAGTTKGVNKNRYNIQTNDGEDMSIFADRVEELQRKQNSNILSIQDENVYFAENPDVETLRKIELAKQVELDNFKHFEVFEEVNRKEIEQKQVIISSRWIIQRKDDGRMKARIVARGYEEGEMSSVDAPTVDKTSLRTILTIATMKKWKCSSLDVKSAFLQSHKLDRDVYLNPPKDIRKDDVLWKIKKPIYGLKDSAKNWYCTLRSELLELGCKESILDPTVFCYYNENVLKGLFICHVDDFLYGGCGDSDFKGNVIDKIVGKYDISSSYDISFTYIGLNLRQQEEGMMIDQKAFTCTVEVEKVNTKNRPACDKLSDTEKKAYQRLLGKINWLANQSRPDLSFDAYCFSLLGQSPTVGDLKRLNKMITKVKTGLEHIWLPVLDENSLCIVAFSDASLANILPDKTSSGEGYLIFLSDSSGNSCLLNWKSKKINRVVHSTVAAECLSLVDCLGDCNYIRNLVEEILFKDHSARKIPIRMFVDSSQLKKAIDSTHLVTEKLLRLNIAEIKQLVQNQEMKTKVHWVKTSHMISDCLTKTGASCEKLCQVLENGYINIEDLIEEENKHASM